MYLFLGWPTTMTPDTAARKRVRKLLPTPAALLSKPGWVSSHLEKTQEFLQWDPAGSGADWLAMLRGTGERSQHPLG